MAADIKKTCKKRQWQKEIKVDRTGFSEGYKKEPLSYREETTETYDGSWAVLTQIIFETERALYGQSIWI